MPTARILAITISVITVIDDKEFRKSICMTKCLAIIITDRPRYWAKAEYRMSDCKILWASTM